MSSFNDCNVSIQVSLHWGDQDLFGHVNNVHFIRWFESSRVRYMEELGIAVSREGVGPILASVTCNYKQQVKYPDTLSIGTRTRAIGITSLTLEHFVWSDQQQATVADGISVVVLFDYPAQSKQPVSDELRARIGQLDAGSGAT